MYIYVYVYMSMYMCMYICVCIYIFVYVYMYMCMYACACIYIYAKSICVYVSEYIYAGVCVYIRMYMYGWVCTWMYVDTCKCMWGALSPPAVWPQGVLFLKSENTESDWHTASPYGLVDLQLPHTSDRGYHMPLAVSVTVVYPPRVVLMYPTLRTYSWPSTNNKDANLTRLPSELTTSTLLTNPITTDSYFLTLNGPASNAYAKVA